MTDDIPDADANFETSVAILKCRECGKEFTPSRPYYHTCDTCYNARKRESDPDKHLNDY